MTLLPRGLVFGQSPGKEAWSVDKFGWKLSPAYSKPNPPASMADWIACNGRFWSGKLFKQIISISWTSQLSLRAELCWEGWGQDLPLLLLLHWTSIAKPVWRGAKWTRRPMGSPGNTSLTVDTMPPSQQTLWSFSTVLLWC